MIALFKKQILPFALLLILLCLCYLLGAANPALALFKKSPQILKEAMYYVKLGDKKVQCVLCPRECILRDGERGFCKVRQNKDGVLYSLVYGKPVSVHLDPIEKKPFFHVYPTTKSLSIATAGCNLGCKFCQNWQISQAYPEDIPVDTVFPENIVMAAKKTKCPTIAYTYTEPTIFYEYMLHTAKLAHKEGIKNVMHSAGYINEEPLRELCKYLDAANIDLKGSEKFYRNLCFGHREDVLKTLKILKEEGVWIEITCLIIPTFNDDTPYIKETCRWIRNNLGEDVPIHFSRFHPTYKLTNISPTPVSTLDAARQIAMDAGLKFVYVGNIPGHKSESTFCPNCGKIIIERMGYTILSNNVVDGKCKYCGEEIPGIWE